MPAQASVPPQYRLARHVRGCFVDGQVILLDLRRGRYVGLPGQSASALALSVLDWPMQVRESPDPNPTGGDRAAKCLAALRLRDLLVPVVDPGNFPKLIEEPTDSLSAATACGPHGWRQLACLCCAAAGAAWWLARLSLEDIAAEVAAMRQRVPLMADRPAQDELPRAVSAYTRLRPFLFTTHDRCLHDSLSLIRFLTVQKLEVNWVIGVRTRPFAAHSWVQSRHLVLNDVHENVRAYTPILVV